MLGPQGKQGKTGEASQIGSMIGKSCGEKDDGHKIEMK